MGVRGNGERRRRDFPRDAIVSSGLGGGSLIYANVLLRKPEKWFVHEGPHKGGYEHWPVTRADLDPHYDRVEKVMAPQRSPLADEPTAARARPSP